MKLWKSNILHSFSATVWLNIWRMKHSQSLIQEEKKVNQNFFRIFTLRRCKILHKPQFLSTTQLVLTNNQLEEVDNSPFPWLVIRFSLTSYLIHFFNTRTCKVPTNVITTRGNFFPKKWLDSCQGVQSYIGRVRTDCGHGRDPSVSKSNQLHVDIFWF